MGMPGDERLVIRRAALENGLKFKRPGFIRNPPVRMRSNHCVRRSKIGLKIGAEIEPTLLGGVSGCFGKKLGLENAMFVMAQFGPRVREENEQLGKPHS